MLERIFTDKNGEELIVRHRKSAVFFLREADIDKPNSYGKDHEQYVCINELKREYIFSDEVFQEFIDYCNKIALESWTIFTPKEIDSFGAEYDDYYDKEFDNNGSLSLSVKLRMLRIGGPYAQPKTNGNIIRFIKFNRRKFESFVYDLNKGAHTCIS